MHFLLKLILAFISLCYISYLFALDIGHIQLCSVLTLGSMLKINCSGDHIGCRDQNQTGYVQSQAFYFQYFLSSSTSLFLIHRVLSQNIPFIIHLYSIFVTFTSSSWHLDLFLCSKVLCWKIGKVGARVVTQQ